jgi:dihydrofolate reductase
MNGEAAAAIKKLKQQRGKDMVLWGSISLVQSLMAENLVDEFHVQLCPVLTGGGRPFFLQSIDFTNLKLLEVRQYNSGTVFLNYQPVK